MRLSGRKRRSAEENSVGANANPGPNVYHRKAAGKPIPRSRLPSNPIRRITTAMAQTESNAAPAQVQTLIENLKPRAERAGVFESVKLRDGRLVCEASNSDAPAFYRIGFEDDRIWVELVMEDRWLSESIEADLVHTGDKLDELVEEEMVELGYEGPRLPFEHYRSSDMLFTFRTALPVEPDKADSDEAARLAEQILLGYEAAFRQLGDMDVSDEEED